jgi:hypothetical protein
MENNDHIESEDGRTSINFPRFGEGNFHVISSAEYATRGLAAEKHTIF